MTFWWVGKVLSHTVPIFGDISYGRVVFFRFLLEQLDILRFQSNVPWWLGESHPVLPWSSETQMSSWPGWPGWPLFSFRFRFPDHVHPCSISNFQPWRVPSPKICLRVWIEQPVFFRTTWCLMSPGYDQRCHFFYFFWLVLMSPEGYSPDSSCLVRALNALNPNFCWSSCLARRTLHWNQPWTVQMAVGEWSPWAPIEQTWHELVHAISCWSVLHIFTNIVSCWFMRSSLWHFVVFHAQPTPVFTLQMRWSFATLPSALAKKPRCSLGHLKDRPWYGKIQRKFMETRCRG